MIATGTPRRKPAPVSGRGDHVQLFLAVVTPLLVMVEILAYGGDRIEAGLIAATAQLALLTGVLLASSTARAFLANARMLRWLYGLFAVVTVWGLVQLAPLPIGMSRDAWASVRALPAMTLDKFATWAELVKLWGLGATFLLGVLVGSRGRSARLSLLLTAALGGLYAAVALAHYLLAQDGGSTSVTRLSATLLNPNNTAALLAMMGCGCLVAALSLVRPARTGAAPPLPLSLFPFVKSAPFFGLLIASAWAASLTGSRGGALAGVAGLAAAAIAFLYHQPKPGRIALPQIILALASAGVAGVVIFNAGLVDDRLLLAPDGVADREANIALYLSRLHLVPWTGFGMGTFHRFNNVMVGSPDATRLWQFGAMHNVYLQWIYEAGWPGALAMFAAIALILGAIIAGLRRLGPDDGWPAVALGCSAILLIHGIVDFDLQIPGIAAFWSLVLGAGFGAVHRARRAVSPSARAPQAKFRGMPSQRR